MKKKEKAMNRIANILLALLIISSCTVKEDRTNCPCWLLMSVKENTGICKNMTFTAWTTGKEKEEEIDLVKNPETYETTVPKGFITTCLYTGINRGEILGSEYHIKLGDDADSLYSYSKEVDCTRETARDTVILKKNFARIYLKAAAVEGEEYPYTLVVRSNICGMNLITDEPISGKFEKKLKLSDQHMTVFTLPRQAANNYSLVIDIYKDKEIVYTVPLGEQIHELEYDWEEKNLKDIYLGVDYAEASVEISIQGWKSDKFLITI